MTTPTVVIVDYLLDLVTSEHNQRPRYMGTVALSVEPYIDGSNIAYSYRTLFDLDTAVGEQLDFVGQWVGITRYIVEPLDVFFTLDDENLGFDFGKFRRLFTIKHAQAKDKRALRKAAINRGVIDAIRPIRISFPAPDTSGRQQRDREYALAANATRRSLPGQNQTMKNPK